MCPRSTYIPIQGTKQSPTGDRDQQEMNGKQYRQGHAGSVSAEQQYLCRWLGVRTKVPYGWAVAGRTGQRTDHGRQNSSSGEPTTAFQVSGGVDMEPICQRATVGGRGLHQVFTVMCISAYVPKSTGYAVAHLIYLVATRLLLKNKITKKKIANDSSQLMRKLCRHYVRNSLLDHILSYSSQG